MTNSEKPEPSLSNACVVCGGEFCWRWTDTHGVAQHVPCGTPYRIYHYDENNKREDKPPSICVKPEYIDLCKQYWEETRRVIPGGHSVPGGYEMADQEDHKVFNEWMAAYSPVESAKAQGREVNDA